MRFLPSFWIFSTTTTTVLLASSFVANAADDGDGDVPPLSSVCGNATEDLRESLVNDTEAWLDSVALTYNLTTVEEYCYTPHFTSSCSLNFTSVPAETAWRDACTAAGGEIYEITEMRFRCHEGTTDYVRLLNFIGHPACVPGPSSCSEEELDDHLDMWMSEEAALFGRLFNDAECELEDEYIPHDGVGTLWTGSMALLTSVVAVTWMWM